MTICRYFQQGNCSYGNRCRYEHIYTNSHSYGGGYGGGGGNNYGGYRNSGGASYGSGYYSSNYNYGSGNSSGGVGTSGGNDRGGTSILRAKAANQFQQTSNLFGPPASNTTSYQPSSGFFSSSVPDQKQSSGQLDVKEIMMMLINEFTIWDHSGQWPLSCFSLTKEGGCFPGLVDYSPEEMRWLMYQARASGNLEEYQQLIKGYYDKAKLVKKQLMTPNAEVYEFLTRFSRGEKMDPPAAPTSLNRPSIFGNASSGNTMHSSQLATSFTFSLPSNPPPTANSQTFSGFTAQPANTFQNSFSNSIFGNASTPAPSGSVFGSVTSQVPQQLNSTANQSVESGFFNSNTNPQTNDSTIYTPMEDVTEEMLNAFNAPVFRMGSVPLKPPPKELCGLRS